VLECNFVICHNKRELFSSLHITVHFRSAICSRPPDAVGPMCSALPMTAVALRVHSSLERSSVGARYTVEFSVTGYQNLGCSDITVCFRRIFLSEAGNEFRGFSDVRHFGGLKIGSPSE
jgi:hypothetical protein